MFRLFVNCSLFQQIAIPMVVIAFIAMFATFHSAFKLKNSIEKTQIFYDVVNTHINTIYDIEKGFSQFRTLGLKHLTAENSQEMIELKNSMIHEKETLFENIDALYTDYLADNEHSVSMSNISLLKQLFEVFHEKITQSIEQSEEFEKEIAFEIWVNAEKEYVSIIDQTIQNFIKEEFSHFSLERNEIVSITKRNLVMTISLGMIGSILLFLIAFFVARRFSKRLMRLLDWSEKFSDDIESVIPDDNVSDEVGRLTSAMSSMSKKIANSHKKLAEAKLVSEKANRAKSDFLANMSHELRTPMHAMLSFSHVGEIKSRTAEPEKLERYFSNINTSGQRLMTLLNDLLDLSKLEAGRMTYNINEHDIGVIIDVAITELKELIDDNNLDIVIDEPESEVLWHFDAEKILQVIRNLLANAIRYSGEGNKIKISSGIKKESDRAPELFFSISDHGVGIPENELELVFDKFMQSSKTRTQSGGTGLGLAICKQIITGHGGIIKASNNPEGGALFYFSIPENSR